MIDSRSAPDRPDGIPDDTGPAVGSLSEAVAWVNIERGEPVPGKAGR